MEIHDGNTGDDESFFKFRTVDPNNNFGSTFDVKTSRFFLGQSTTQFVSGALGNLEISSSNFHFCLLYTSPSPRDLSTSRMPSSA